MICWHICIITTEEWPTLINVKKNEFTGTSYSATDALSSYTLCYVEKTFKTAIKWICNFDDKSNL